MGYKVGDYVLVRNDLVPDEWYGSDTFIPEMKNCLGRIVYIQSVHPYLGKYRITGNSWWWTDEMFVCKIPPSDNMVIK